MSFDIIKDLVVPANLAEQAVARTNHELLTATWETLLESGDSPYIAEILGNAADLLSYHWAARLRTYAETKPIDVQSMTGKPVVIDGMTFSAELRRGNRMDEYGLHFVTLETQSPAEHSKAYFAVRDLEVTDNYPSHLRSLDSAFYTPPAKTIEKQYLVRLMHGIPNRVHSMTLSDRQRNPAGWATGKSIELNFWPSLVSS